MQLKTILKIKQQFFCKNGFLFRVLVCNFCALCAHVLYRNCGELFRVIFVVAFQEHADQKGAAPGKSPATAAGNLCQYAMHM